MKGKTILLFLITVMLLSISPLFARGEKEAAPAETRPIVKVAGNVQIPMRFYYEGTEAKGYEYEVVKEALNRAGYDIHVVDVHFAGIMPGLQAEKWRIATSNIFITAVRAAEMSYSEPYLEAFDCVIIREKDNSIKTLSDLKGKVVGTEVGTTQAAYAEKLNTQHGPFQIRGFEDKETQFMDLELGRIDALTLGYPTAVDRIKREGMFKIVGYSEDNFMIGSFFRKGDPLQAEFNKALQGMKKDGTTAKLYEKYFNQKAPAGSAPITVFDTPYVPKK